MKRLSIPIVSKVFIILSIILYSLTFKIRRVPEIISQGFQPTMFPRMIIILMFALSIILIFTKHEIKYTVIPSILFKTITLLFLYLLSIYVFGIIISLFWAAIVLPYLWGHRNHVTIIIFAILFTMVIYLLFSGVLGIPFKDGLLLSRIFY